MSKLISTKIEHFENHLDKNIPKWFAVYTHFKREKIAAKDLTKSGIDVYIPLQNVTRQYVRKVKKVTLPLINQYIFVKITKKEYVHVLQSSYVLNFVKFSKNLISIPEQEILLIKRILGEVEHVEICNSLQKGDEVEIIGGNLTGLKGILIQKENNQYFSVKLIKLGLSLNLVIAANLLRKIKPAVFL